MGISERKQREREERERRIVIAAKTIAEQEGWEAVTIRRLAAEIEHSQPVIYSHFASRDAIIAAVAVEGFGELATSLHGAISDDLAPSRALEAVATAYLDFALARPALCDAMFVLPIDLRFARSDTPAELRRTFGTLMAVLEPFCQNVETAAEALWAALHGLAMLERHGRIRAPFRAERVALVVSMIAGKETGQT